MIHRSILLLALGGLLGGPVVRPTPLSAQRDSLRTDSSHVTRIGVIPVAATLGAIAVASVADKPIRDYLQRHRSGGKDDVATIFKDMGEPDIYAPIPLGLIAVGLVSGNHKITRAGGRITAGLLTAGALTNILKPIGRVRPKFADDAYQVTPLKGSYSWPSGHSSMAFALATGISDEVHFLPLSIGLYGAATMTGWSRMNDNRHWLTDVLGGMLVGITSAKVMNGHWSFLGITGPGFLQEPDQRGMKERRAHLLLTPGTAGLSIDF